MQTLGCCLFSFPLGSGQYGRLASSTLGVRAGDIMRGYPLDVTQQVAALTPMLKQHRSLEFQGFLQITSGNAIKL